MKLNKAMLILAAAGLLTSAASYAADTTATTSGPQEATATLNVSGGGISISNDLRPTSELISGHTYSASDIVAMGIVTSNGGKFSAMTLKWDRALNPIATTGDPSTSVLRSVDGKHQAEVRIMMDKSPTDKEDMDVGNDLVRYRFAPETQAAYQVEVLNDGETFAPGNYKLGVIADAFAA
ncbi:hypothetical protein [Escherichia coli]|uniref:hypothetical protein n=1 Tax=Escherichia coli TaxID=562 RepID=UPI001918C93A|nr:hypothetical protein [Escherichia coli]CAD6107006.1 Uncharacterised protein [Escherichia coli]CAD6111402.1 Uncharacterised protein [Escherichia coli]CAD6181140.1 Uncharacterised protein [Escherichia coli]